MPLNLSSHPNNVVLAMKLPYIEGFLAKELKNITAGIFDDINKVCYESV